MCVGVMTCLEKHNRSYLSSSFVLAITQFPKLSRVVIKDSVLLKSYIFDDSLLIARVLRCYSISHSKGQRNLNMEG